MKVRVHYENLKTGRKGSPVHPIPKRIQQLWLIHGEKYLFNYLSDEVKRWNPHNMLISYDFARSDDIPGHIGSTTIQSRDREVKEVWQPQLDDIARETCEKLNEPMSDEYLGYTITYNHQHSGWAQINWNKKYIYVGHKFFRMTEEDKRKVLQHEFSHPILRYHKHTGKVKQRMMNSDVVVSVDPKYVDRIPIKYEIYCNSCNSVIARRRQKSKVIRSIEKGNHHYLCKKCKSTDLSVRKV